MWPKALFGVVSLSLSVAGTSPGQTEQHVGDVPDGNRSSAVHLLKLYDADDHVIKPDDRPVLPFSTKQTCGKCHNYERISRGWHFNAADTGTAAGVEAGAGAGAGAGRNGEPWFLVDPAAATQIPVSYRRWPGTRTPTEAGLSSFAFLTRFGRHFPGGGIGEREEGPDDYLRWQVSGRLEINCQLCHNGDPGQSPAEYGVQVLRQNFRWAAAAGSGFAVVQGSAAEMPDNFDLYAAVPPEKSNMLPPTVTYNASRIDVAGRVLFDVPRRMPAAQCAFCHSSKVVEPSQPERWKAEEDVHLAAGMTCVDCHRNGVDHAILRGDEDDPGSETFTCRGCHLGTGSDDVPLHGRRGAPRPEHLGIPPVHFERLACTTCHSGPWPASTTYSVKTSRAHALGIPRADKSDAALPHIATPVFVRQPDGTYAPHNLLWPAFWAYRQGESERLIPPEQVRPILSAILTRDTTRVPGPWPVLRDSDVVAVLQLLHLLDSTAGGPVYVSGGEVLSIGRDGALQREEGESARPYAWPIAHDVRPAAQSLGIRSCTDCHATDAPFHFGRVRIGSPFMMREDSTQRMTEFQDRSAASTWLFSMSFLFRPGLKVLVILCFVFIALVVLGQALRGLAHIIRKLAAEQE